MSAKIKILSLIGAAFIVAQSVNASAIEPPNMKLITDEDKIYFGARLDREQIEKLQHVINPNQTANQPCANAAEITKTLRYLKEVTPIFREASASADISAYARKYSASLTHELDRTSKALNQMLSYYRKACAGGKEVASRPD